MEPLQQTRHLTIAAAAARLGVAYNTVRNAILAGRLVAYRFGVACHIRPEDLQQYVGHLDGARLRATLTRQGVRAPGEVEAVLRHPRRRAAHQLGHRLGVDPAHDRRGPEPVPYAGQGTPRDRVI
jgi:excisionase family DNA binding protein